MRDLVTEGYIDQTFTLKVIETGERATIRQKLRSGKEILVTGNPIFDDLGNIIMVVTNDRDMTELIKLHEQVEHSMQMAMAYKEKLQTLQESSSFGKDFVVVSRAMYDVLQSGGAGHKTDATVALFYGAKRASGKDRLVEAVHKMSAPAHARACWSRSTAGAISGEPCWRASLFGYEAGAFTGAAKKEGKIGLFELADERDDVFLDE
jgi:transcriptional regulator with PAS, ATPase and Fis domain